MIHNGKATCHVRAVDPHKGSGDGFSLEPRVAILHREDAKILFATHAGGNSDAVVQS